nr:fibrous sheath CABYR-binding protein [Haemonchus contortus]
MRYFLFVTALVAATSASYYGVGDRSPSRLHFKPKFEPVRVDSVVKASEADLNKAVEELASLGEELKKLNGASDGSEPDALAQPSANVPSVNPYSPQLQETSPEVPVPPPAEPSVPTPVDVSPAEDEPAETPAPLPLQATTTTPTTTFKYVLNEKAAEAYWKTFVPPVGTTMAPPAEGVSSGKTNAPVSQDVSSQHLPSAESSATVNEPPVENVPTEPPVVSPVEATTVSVSELPLDDASTKTDVVPSVNPYGSMSQGASPEAPVPPPVEPTAAPVPPAEDTPTEAPTLLPSQATTAQTTTFKYVLNEKAAEAYWKTFVPPVETTVAPPAEDVSSVNPHAPVAQDVPAEHVPPAESSAAPTDVKPVEELPTEVTVGGSTTSVSEPPAGDVSTKAEVVPSVNPYGSVPQEASPDAPVITPVETTAAAVNVPPAEDVPSEAPTLLPLQATTAPTTTFKYVLNEKAAEAYWKTFVPPVETTMAPSVEEASSVNPHAPVNQDVSSQHLPRAESSATVSVPPVKDVPTEPPVVSPVEATTVTVSAPPADDASTKTDVVPSVNPYGSVPQEASPEAPVLPPVEPTAAPLPPAEDVPTEAPTPLPSQESTAPTTTFKYVLNEKAAEAYWKTFVPPVGTTMAPSAEDVSSGKDNAPVTQDVPAEHVPLAESSVSSVNVPSAENVPAKVPITSPVEETTVSVGMSSAENVPTTMAPLEATTAPTTTFKYVLNEKAAEAYWKTFVPPVVTTAAPPAKDASAETSEPASVLPAEAPSVKDTEVLTSSPSTDVQTAEEVPISNPYAPPVISELATLPPVPVTPELLPLGGMGPVVIDVPVVEVQNTEAHPTQGEPTSRKPKVEMKKGHHPKGPSESLSPAEPALAKHRKPFWY